MKVKRRLKKFLHIAIIISVITFVLYYFQYIVNPVIYSVSEGQVRMGTIRAVNNAIAEVVANVNIYDSLCNIITDEEGNVAMVSANALRINNLTKELIKVSQEKIEKLVLDTVKIPLGNFSGIPLLSGFGPQIKLRVVPMGSMSCYFVSEFTQAGINQTNHRIYVNFESYVNLVMPLESRQIETKSQVLICECIIVGKVPNVYLQGNLLDMVQKNNQNE